jgi:hypothetical protein
MTCARMSNRCSTRVQIAWAVRKCAVAAVNRIQPSLIRPCCCFFPYLVLRAHQGDEICDDLARTALFESREAAVSSSRQDISVSKEHVSDK